MFLRIKIRKEDRDAQRFLWRGMRRYGPPDVYRMDSMIFGSVCSPAAAIYVTRENADRYKDEFPEAVDVINKTQYMDDCVSSRDTVDEAKKIIRDVIEIHSRGGFIMRNWYRT